jgi:hypothetical protein
MMPCHTEAAPHIQNRFGKNSRECNADFCKIEDIFGYRLFKILFLLDLRSGPGRTLSFVVRAPRKSWAYPRKPATLSKSGRPA